jgi:hypothetical protein
MAATKTIAEHSKGIATATETEKKASTNLNPIQQVQTTTHFTLSLPKDHQNNHRKQR